MAWRSGVFSRSLLSTSRASTFRTSPSPSLGRLCPSPSLLIGQSASSPRLISSALPRTARVLGCTQSLLSLHSVVATTRLTSHLSVQARACCELSQGT